MKIQEESGKQVDYKQAKVYKNDKVWLGKNQTTFLGEIQTREFQWKQRRKRKHEFMWHE